MDNGASRRHLGALFPMKAIPFPALPVPLPLHARAADESPNLLIAIADDAGAHH